ncbi:hypothetical protein D9758_015389 [Tetrapyrgos nigripes]|uniref:Uncharacterized protein n=1 Tax=Tetrapyrgos nigripes TaxID=182062 RepID=A0A8H5CBK0_9AGAR|nr:hypothetical protein D9758_015389 [Tetrapyrgos nigripes]
MPFDGILTANETTTLIIVFCLLALGALAFVVLFSIHALTTKDDIFGDDAAAFEFEKARFIVADPRNEAAYTNVTVSAPHPMNVSNGAIDRVAATRWDRDADQRLVMMLKDSGFIV